MGTNTTKNCGCSSTGNVLPDDCCTSPASQTTCSEVVVDPCAAAVEQEQKNCTPSCTVNADLFISLLASFNMPGCGETGEIQVSDASRVSKGAVLYADVVGYLKVTQVKDGTTLVVLNECSSCNLKQPGEPIDTLTTFTVGIPSCGTGSPIIDPTQPFLNSDFVIPGDGECVTIKVTNVLGLSINDIVSIVSNEYRIDEIIDATTIRICNEGNGGTEGALVEDDANCDGIPDHPVVKIGGENPCTNSVDDCADRLIVCDGGVQKSIVGTVQNHGMVWNNETEKWCLQVLDDVIECTTLTSCFITDPEAPAEQTYLVQVANTDIFAGIFGLYENPLITIDGDDFCLVEVEDGVGIRVKPFPAPPEAGKKYDVGDPVCIADCCLQCKPVIQTLKAIGAGIVNDTNENQREILIPTADSGTMPDGVSVVTFPIGIGQDGSGTEPDAEYAWRIRYTNPDKCTKYFEVITNFEMTLLIPAGVFANVEYRVNKTQLGQEDTGAFAAIPMNGGRGLLPTLNNTPNLLIAQLGDFMSLNTFKGNLTDRDRVSPGEQTEFKGHIRIVFENTTGAPQDWMSAGAWRAWYKAFDFEVGPGE